MKKNKLIMIALTIIVTLTVVYGFVDGGSPQAARNKRNDDKRIQDIQSMKNWINSYYTKNTTLPATLQEAAASYSSSGNSKVPVDPETNNAYLYQIVTDKEYKICATFSTNTSDTTQKYMVEYEHPSGSHCLTFQGDKY